MHGKQCKMWWFSVNSLVVLFRLQSFIRALLVQGGCESHRLLLLVEMHLEFIVGACWSTSGRGHIPLACFPELGDAF